MRVLDNGLGDLREYKVMGESQNLVYYIFDSRNVIVEILL